MDKTPTNHPPPLKPRLSGDQHYVQHVHDNPHARPLPPNKLFHNFNSPHPTQSDTTVRSIPTIISASSPCDSETSCTQINHQPTTSHTAYVPPYPFTTSHLQPLQAVTKTTPIQYLAYPPTTHHYTDVPSTAHLNTLTATTLSPHTGLAHHRPSTHTTHPTSATSILFSPMQDTLDPTSASLTTLARAHIDSPQSDISTATRLLGSQDAATNGLLMGTTASQTSSLNSRNNYTVDTKNNQSKRIRGIQGNDHPFNPNINQYNINNQNDNENNDINMEIMSHEDDSISLFDRMDADISDMEETLEASKTATSMRAANLIKGQFHLPQPSLVPHQSHTNAESDQSSQGDKIITPIIPGSHSGSAQTPSRSPLLQPHGLSHFTNSAHLPWPKPTFSTPTPHSQFDHIGADVPSRYVLGPDSTASITSLLDDPKNLVCTSSSTAAQPALEDPFSSQHNKKHHRNSLYSKSTRTANETSSEEHDPITPLSHRPGLLLSTNDNSNDTSNAHMMFPLGASQPSLHPQPLLVSQSLTRNTTALTPAFIRGPSLTPASSIWPPRNAPHLPLPTTVLNNSLSHTPHRLPSLLGLTGSVEATAVDIKGVTTVTPKTTQPPLLPRVPTMPTISTISSLQHFIPGSNLPHGPTLTNTPKPPITHQHSSPGITQPTLPIKSTSTLQGDLMRDLQLNLSPTGLSLANNVVATTTTPSVTHHQQKHATIPGHDDEEHNASRPTTADSHCTRYHANCLLFPPVLDSGLTNPNPPSFTITNPNSDSSSMQKPVTLNTDELPPQNHHNDLRPRVNNDHLVRAVVHNSPIPQFAHVIKDNNRGLTNHVITTNIIPFPNPIDVNNISNAGQPKSRDDADIHAPQVPNNVSSTTTNINKDKFFGGRDHHHTINLNNQQQQHQQQSSGNIPPIYSNMSNLRPDLYYHHVASTLSYHSSTKRRYGAAMSMKELVHSNVFQDQLTHQTKQQNGVDPQVQFQRVLEDVESAGTIGDGYDAGSHHSRHNQNNNSNTTLSFREAIPNDHENAKNHNNPHQRLSTIVSPVGDDMMTTTATMMSNGSREQYQHNPNYSNSSQHIIQNILDINYTTHGLTSAHNQSHRRSQFKNKPFGSKQQQIRLQYTLQSGTDIQSTSTFQAPLINDEDENSGSRSLPPPYVDIVSNGPNQSTSTSISTVAESNTPMSTFNDNNINIFDTTQLQHLQNSRIKIYGMHPPDLTKSRHFPPMRNSPLNVGNTITATTTTIHLSEQTFAFGSSGSMHLNCAETGIGFVISQNHEIALSGTVANNNTIHESILNPFTPAVSINESSHAIVNAESYQNHSLMQLRSLAQSQMSQHSLFMRAESETSQKQSRTPALTSPIPIDEIVPFLQFTYKVFSKYYFSPTNTPINHCVYNSVLEKNDLVNLRNVSPTALRYSNYEDNEQEYIIEKSFTPLGRLGAGCSAFVTANVIANTRQIVAIKALSATNADMRKQIRAEIIALLHNRISTISFLRQQQHTQQLNSGIVPSSSSKHVLLFQNTVNMIGVYADEGFVTLVLEHMNSGDLFNFLTKYHKWHYTHYSKNCHAQQNNNYNHNHVVSVNNHNNNTLFSPYTNSGYNAIFSPNNNLQNDNIFSSPSSLVHNLSTITTTQKSQQPFQQSSIISQISPYGTDIQSDLKEFTPAPQLSPSPPPFNEDLIQYVAASLLIAIDTLHTNNYIHRDIKPHNVLLHTDARCCLSDFGLCTSLKPNEDIFSTLNPSENSSPHRSITSEGNMSSTSDDGVISSHHPPHLSISVSTMPLQQPSEGSNQTMQPTIDSNNPHFHIIHPIDEEPYTPMSTKSNKQNNHSINTQYNISASNSTTKTRDNSINNCGQNSNNNPDNDNNIPNTNNVQPTQATELTIKDAMQNCHKIAHDRAIRAYRPPSNTSMRSSRVIQNSRQADDTLKHINLFTTTNRATESFRPQPYQAQSAPLHVPAQVVGTKQYLAPELLLISVQSKTNDIWSYGLTLLHMINGDLSSIPAVYWQLVHFYQSHTPSSLRQVLSVKPQFAPYYSNELHDFLAKCLTILPTERYNTVQLLGHPFLSKMKYVRTYLNKKAMLLKPSIFPFYEELKHLNFLIDSAIEENPTLSDNEIKKSNDDLSKKIQFDQRVQDILSFFHSNGIYDKFKKSLQQCSTCNPALPSHKSENHLYPSMDSGNESGNDDNNCDCILGNSDEFDINSSQELDDIDGDNAILNFTMPSLSNNDTTTLATTTTTPSALRHSTQKPIYRRPSFKNHAHMAYFIKMKQAKKNSIDYKLNEILYKRQRLLIKYKLPQYLPWTTEAVFLYDEDDIQQYLKSNRLGPYTNTDPSSDHNNHTTNHEYLTNMFTELDQFDPVTSNKYEYQRTISIVKFITILSTFVSQHLPTQNQDDMDDATQFRLLDLEVVQDNTAQNRSVGSSNKSGKCALQNDDNDLDNIVLYHSRHRIPGYRKYKQQQQLKSQEDERKILQQGSVNNVSINPNASQDSSPNRSNIGVGDDYQDLPQLTLDLSRENLRLIKYLINHSYHLPPRPPSPRESKNVPSKQQNPQYSHQFNSPPQSATHTPSAHEQPLHSIGINEGRDNLATHPNLTIDITSPTSKHNNLSLEPLDNIVSPTQEMQHNIRRYHQPATTTAIITANPTFSSHSVNNTNNNQHEDILKSQQPQPALSMFSPNTEQQHNLNNLSNLNDVSQIGTNEINNITGRALSTLFGQFSPVLNPQCPQPNMQMSSFHLQNDHKQTNQVPTLGSQTPNPYFNATPTSDSLFEDGLDGCSPLNLQRNTIQNQHANKSTSYKPQQQASNKPFGGYPKTTANPHSHLNDPFSAPTATSYQFSGSRQPFQLSGQFTPVHPNDGCISGQQSAVGNSSLHGTVDSILSPAIGPFGSMTSANTNLQLAQFTQSKPFFPYNSQIQPTSKLQPTQPQQQTQLQQQLPLLSEQGMLRRNTTMTRLQTPLPSSNMMITPDKMISPTPQMDYLINNSTTNTIMTSGTQHNTQRNFHNTHLIPPIMGKLPNNTSVAFTDATTSTLTNFYTNDIIIRLLKNNTLSLTNYEVSILFHITTQLGLCWEKTTIIIGQLLHCRTDNFKTSIFTTIDDGSITDNSSLGNDIESDNNFSKNVDNEDAISLLSSTNHNNNHHQRQTRYTFSTNHNRHQFLHTDFSAQQFPPNTLNVNLLQNNIMPQHPPPNLQPILTTTSSQYTSSPNTIKSDTGSDTHLTPHTSNLGYNNLSGFSESPF